MSLFHRQLITIITRAPAKKAWIQLGSGHQLGESNDEAVITLRAGVEIAS